jgi:hypothetical protein
MSFVCAIGLNKTKLPLHCKFFGYIANFIAYIRTEKVARGYWSSSEEEEETMAFPQAVTT